MDKGFFIEPLNRLDVESLIGEAVESNEDAATYLNERQLDIGIDAGGNSLGRYRNFSYKNRWEPVDLKLTGEFRRRFTLSSFKAETNITSTDSKTAKLERKYGGDIFGLTKQSLSIFGSVILDYLTSKKDKILSELH